eukprot:NODE_74_length_24438_cov_0.900283.p2 type:complete len:506 gc:universal NODE_74_length_24438_cov_0.900283:18881-20398(+)
MTLKKFLDISLILKNIDNPIYCLDYLVNWSVHIEEIEALDLNAHTDLYQQLYKLKPSEESAFGKHYYRILSNFFTQSPTETALIWHYLNGSSNTSLIYDEGDLMDYFMSVIEFVLRNDDKEGPILPISTPIMSFDEVGKVFEDVKALNLPDSNLWNYCMYLLCIRQDMPSSKYLQRMGDYVPRHFNSKGDIQILFALMIQSINQIIVSMKSQDKKKMLRDCEASLENIRTRSKDLHLKDYEYVSARLVQVSKDLMKYDTLEHYVGSKDGENMSLYLKELQKYCFSYDLSIPVQHRRIPTFFRTFEKNLSSNYFHRTNFSISGNAIDSLLNSEEVIQICELGVLFYDGHHPSRIYLQLQHTISQAESSDFKYAAILGRLIACIVDLALDNVSSIAKLDGLCRDGIAHGDNFLKSVSLIIRGKIYLYEKEEEKGIKLCLLGLNDIKRHLEINHLRELFLVFFKQYCLDLDNLGILNHVDKFKYLEKEQHLYDLNFSIPIPPNKFFQI